MSQRSAKMTKNELQTATEKADDETSVRGLMAAQESTNIITSPRDYQIQLFEKAKAQNVIAVLDTGCYFQGLMSFFEALTSSRLGQDTYCCTLVEAYHRHRARGPTQWEETADSILPGVSFEVGNIVSVLTIDRSIA